MTILLKSNGKYPTAIARCFPIGKSQTGQAAVELALIIPLLFLFFLGTIEFGRLAYIAIETSSAARAGAQYGGQNHITAANIAGMQQAALEDAPELTRLTATPQVICQCSTSLGTNLPCTNTCRSGRVIVFVQVVTLAQFTPWLPYPGSPTSVTVKGEATSVVGQ
jgi:Flp pilus assembly protein TadG